MNFFSTATGKTIPDYYIDLIQLFQKRKEKEENGNAENHRDVITRLLYVFARTNKVIGYLQGMNEIVSILYYCFHVYGFQSDQENAEADTF